MRTHLKLLIAMCMTAFLSSFMGSSLNIAMPYVAQDYNCPPENVTWMINAFTATTAAFLLSSSALADRFGYLKIFLLGIFTSAILSLGVALAPNLPLSSLLRALQGASMSLVFCTSMALISQRIEREHRAFAIAYYTSSVYAGLTFSPVIAGLIVDTLGWQTMFYITAAGFFLAFFLIRDQKQDTPVSNRLPLWRMICSFLIGLAILIALSGYTSDSRLLYLLAAGLVALVIYLVIEYRSSSPLLPLKFIMANRVLAYALLASIFHYFGSFIFTLLIAMHLQLIMGYPAATTGFILLLQPLLMVIFSSMSGKLSHMVGPQYITITGMSLCLCGILLLFTLEPASTLSLIFTAQVLLGIGFGLFSAPNTVIVMSSVKPQQYALASAVQSISRTVGQAASMAVLTALLHYMINAEVGTTLYIRELSYSIHISFNISAVSYCIGLTFCFCCLKNRIAVVRARKAAEAAAAATAASAAAAADAEAINAPTNDGMTADTGSDEGKRQI